MYYKIRDNILFRKYNGYGYITDNSEYGYRMLDDKRKYPGEKYVSISGAVMLSMLKKVPRHIEEILNELLQIFIGVEYVVLKKDTIEFFNIFANEGFIVYGETIESCNDKYFDEFQGNKLKDSYTQIEHINGVTNQNELLRSIHIEVADKCNERCVHCYIPNECKNSTIDSNLFYRIIEEGLDMNIIHITLSGGEPLIHKDIVNFLKKCREADLSVNILSNLTLLTEDIILEMKKNPLLSVQASLYSMDASVHDSITKLNGSFEKTKSGIIRLCDEGIPVQISCPIIKQNRETCVDVLHWGWSHNIAVSIEPMIFATYDHSGNNLENRLTIEDIDIILNMQMKEGYANEIYRTAEYKEKLKANDPICSVCRYSFCVDTNGNVYPCEGWQNNLIGDLSCQSIKEVWENSKKVQELRSISRGKFSKCTYCKDRGYCTVCMMWNSNESLSGNPFDISEYRCKVAELTHERVKEALFGYNKWEL